MSKSCPHTEPIMNTGPEKGKWLNVLANPKNNGWEIFVSMVIVGLLPKNRVLFYAVLFLEIGLKILKLAKAIPQPFSLCCCNW